MTIKKLGRMGAVLGLCLTISIMSLGSIIAHSTVKASASNEKNIEGSYLNTINSLSINLFDTTLLDSQELEELLEIGKIKDNNCEYKIAGDKNNLYSIINLNSKNYLNSGNYKLISEIEEDKIRKYIEVTILDILNKALIDKTRNEDVHKLLSLKILIGDFQDKTQYGEYFDSDNLIVISLNNILKNANTVDDLYMSLYDTINHEFNHMFVSPCEDNINNYKLPKEVGVSFLNEAMAESYNYNILKSTYRPVNHNYSYGYNNLEERKYESKLFLLSFLDNSTSITDYYDSLFKENMADFCNYFNANSDTEIKELFSVIWLIDGRLVRNSYWSRLLGSSDFSKLNNININQFLTDNTKGVVESYLLKKSVSALINYNLTKEQLSLDENLILYHFILVNILDSASYNNYDYTTHEVSYTFYKDFINNYEIIEEAFMQYLSSANGMSYESVKEYYEEKNKSEWLNDITSYVKNKTTNSVDGSKIANLINKFPKIKNIVNGGTFLSDFNYNNLMAIIKANGKNKNGFKLILK